MYAPPPPLTPQEQKEWVIDTLRWCGLHLLEEDDDAIAYEIFEQFDIGAFSSLHESALKRIREAGLLTDDVAERCLELREKYLAIEGTDLWTVEAVRAAPEWRGLMELSDGILRAILGE